MWCFVCTKANFANKQKQTELLFFYNNNVSGSILIIWDKMKNKMEKKEDNNTCSITLVSVFLQFIFDVSEISEI
jgi:hypothetical protein